MPENNSNEAAEDGFAGKEIDDFEIAIEMAEKSAKNLNRIQKIQSWCAQKRERPPGGGFCR